MFSSCCGDARPSFDAESGGARALLGPMLPRQGPALALTARHPLLFNRVCCTSWPNLADENFVSGTIKVAPPRAASFPVCAPALACPHGSGRAIDEERQRKWATSW